jgi:hypothetical protein
MHTWATHYPTGNEIRETGTGLFDVSVKVEQSYNVNVYGRDKKCMKIGMVEEKCWIRWAVSIRMDIVTWTHLSLHFSRMLAIRFILNQPHNYRFALSVLVQ